jgi:diacylglycerol kinase
MENTSDSTSQFTLVKRAQSFTHAGRGIAVFFRTTPNVWIHLILFLCALGFGWYVGLSRIEWMLFLITSGFVFVAEAFNTAIEIDINLTSPEYHPHARDTKDVAAGAVLLAACTAFCMGVFIFAPHVIGLLH